MLVISSGVIAVLIFIVGTLAGLLVPVHLWTRYPRLSSHRAAILIWIAMGIGVWLFTRSFLWTGLSVAMQLVIVAVLLRIINVSPTAQSMTQQAAKRQLSQRKRKH